MDRERCQVGKIWGAPGHGHEVIAMIGTVVPGLALSRLGVGLYGAPRQAGESRDVVGGPLASPLSSPSLIVNPSERKKAVAQ
jgi:hypothetical protein